jgi:hypothetical protein
MRQKTSLWRFDNGTTTFRKPQESGFDSVPAIGASVDDENVTQICIVQPGSGKRRKKGWTKGERKPPTTSMLLLFEADGEKRAPPSIGIGTSFK